jgi:tRNA(Arg) A34 adenosine deaminase TadA
MLDMFEVAIDAAQLGSNLERGFVLGAAGVRKDGTIVTSKNGAVHSTSSHIFRSIPSAHAEVRLCRKLGNGGEVYVVRLSKRDGSLVMSRPCFTCRQIMSSRHVKKVYYSINSHQYGVLSLESDRDVVYDM